MTDHDHDHDDNEPMLEQLRKQYAIERKNLLADMAERQRRRRIT